jgi:hypothetical protein
MKYFATRIALFVCCFCLVMPLLAQETKTYTNDKLNFSFSYPAKYERERINDEEWMIRTPEKNWVVNFKIMHLNGETYETYANKFALAFAARMQKVTGMAITASEAPEPFLVKNKDRVYGFALLTNYYYFTTSEGGEPILAISVFLKLKHGSFGADGIMAYGFQNTTDNIFLEMELMTMMQETIKFNVKSAPPAVSSPVVVAPPVATPPVVAPPVIAPPVVSAPVVEPVPFTTNEPLVVTKHEKEYKYGYSDKNGNPVVPFKYDYASELREGFGCVKRKGRFGFIDNTGKLAIPIIYEQSGFWFSEGCVYMMLDGKWGFINTRNEVVIPFKYDGAVAFKEGFAAVKLNEKWGYVDKQGAVVIPFRYDGTFIFSEGMSSVMLNGKWGFIDKEGKEIIPPIYDNVNKFENGRARVTLNGVDMYLDKNGKQVREHG